MASGHVNRTQRPNTWLHRPMLHREETPCQLGAVHTWPIADLALRKDDVRNQGKSRLQKINSTRFSACSNARPPFAFGVNLWVEITCWS